MTSSTSSTRSNSLDVHILLRRRLCLKKISNGIRFWVLVSCQWTVHCICLITYFFNSIELCRQYLFKVSSSSYVCSETSIVNYESTQTSDVSDTSTSSSQSCVPTPIQTSSDLVRNNIIILFYNKIGPLRPTSVGNSEMIQSPCPPVFLSSCSHPQFHYLVPRIWLIFSFISVIPRLPPPFFLLVSQHPRLMWRLSHSVITLLTLLSISVWSLTFHPTPSLVV